MNSDTLRTVFAPPHWREATNDFPRCDFAFVRSDVAVVVVLGVDSADAADRWPEVQTSIEEFRRVQLPPPDCYLVLLVPEVSDADFDLLRPAMDDTLVCRKLVVPLDGRELATALMEDFPLVAPFTVSSENAAGFETGAGDPSESELEWMATTGVEVLVDQLLEELRKTP